MRAHLLLLAVLPYIAGCGDEVAVSFNSLSGNYQVADDCFINVSGSKGQASCNWNENDGGYEAERSGTLGLTLGESQISVNLSGTKRERWCYGAGDCDGWSTCTWTISGTASKQSDRSDTGMFAPLAGLWAGSAVIQKHCVLSEDYTEDQTRNVTFTADVFGTVATIDYNGVITPKPEYDDDSFSDRFSVIATNTGLSIDGAEVRKL